MSKVSQFFCAIFHFHVPKVFMSLKPLSPPALLLSCLVSNQLPLFSCIRLNSIPQSMNFFQELPLLQTVFFVLFHTIQLEIHPDVRNEREDRT